MQAAAYSVVVFLVLLTGCASSLEQGSDPATRNAYSSFKEALVSDKPVVWEKYLSQQWMTMLDEAGTAAEQDELREFASYPLWLTDIDSWHQTRRDQSVCFLANGTASDQAPGSVSVQFVREDGKLKANEIHYQYWQEESEFPEQALCPDQFGMDLPG